MRLRFFFTAFPSGVPQGTRAVLQNGTLPMSSKMFTSSSGRTRNSTYYFQDCEHFPASSSPQILKIRWLTTLVCIRSTPSVMHPQWGQSRRNITQRSLIDAPTGDLQHQHLAHASGSSIFERWISRYLSDSHVMNFFIFILLYFLQLLPRRFPNLSNLSFLNLDSIRYFVPEIFL